MKDSVYAHASSLRSGHEGPRHERRGAPPPEAGLCSFEWLDEQLATCDATLWPALGPFARAVRQWELRAESRLTTLFHPEVPPSSLREVALTVHLVLEGPTSHIPIFWQATAAESPLARFHATLEQSLLAEVRAALEGEPLGEFLSCPTVLEPWLASQLIHECIGHTSEADNFLAYARPRGHALGAPWTDFPLQVFDDPLRPGHRGSYTLDHEGQPARRTQLVKDGRWNELLHNRETLGRLGEGQAGNGRRVPGAARTLPRMSVTYAAPGNSSVGELISQVERGLYCAGTWGGGSIGPDFILRPVYGRWIHEGRLTDRYVRRFDMRGGKFDVLSKLAGLADDLTLFDPAFGCDKDGQDNLPITLGAPHLLLREAPLYPIASRPR